LAVRATGFPFEGRATLPFRVPLDRTPLLEPLPACFEIGPLAPFAPFCFGFTPFAAFGFQRVVAEDREPAAGRALDGLVDAGLEDAGRADVGRADVGLADAGRTSAPVRRAGRLAADDCAGFRSREWVAGRLKWGRDAMAFPFEAGLRAAAGRSAGMRGV
jgi:hypothetical protein